MKELSAWTRFCEQTPGKMDAFASLDDSVKAKLISSSPLRVCRFRFPRLVEHVEQHGGLAARSYAYKFYLCYFMFMFFCYFRLLNVLDQFFSEQGFR